MKTRRALLLQSAALAVAVLSRVGLAEPPHKLLFVHGRSQQGKDPGKLKATWIEAFKKGADAANLPIPDDLDIAFPYYGDALDEFTHQSNLPLTTDIQARGESAVNEDFLEFQAEIAEELREARGITEDQVNEEYGENPKPKGPLNWEWVQAILRTLDKHGGGINQAALEQFTRDVYLYTRRSVVREAIDKIVAEKISEEPTVVLGHSLGTVVTYSVLRYDPRSLNVPLFVTVGSPLGVRAIRRQFRPLESPRAGQWFNAYDDRDVVALYPLDNSNFPIDPPVENYAGVRNHTSNRHGIVGYLDDVTVASKLLHQLEA